MTRTYNAVELFVGAGGLALGLQRAGFGHRADDNRYAEKNNAGDA